MEVDLNEMLAFAEDAVFVRFYQQVLRALIDVADKYGLPSNAIQSELERL